VFATSSLQAPASLGGLAKADTVCMDRAREGGLQGRFVAFLSLQSLRARDRLNGARGWYRLDGEPVADTVDDLVGVRVILPIALDERGNDLSNDDKYVTTGSYAGMQNATCGDYTEPTKFAAAGRTHYGAGGWMNTDNLFCSQPTRLYCFQIDYDLPVTYTRASGRIAFVSTATFTPSSGINAPGVLPPGVARYRRTPITLTVARGM